MDATNNLVTMANQIGAFFETMPDRRQALEDIAGHLKRFWEPRMRKALLQYADDQGGFDLKEIVLEALRIHKSSIL
jgi:formate dehydrogenase subunit delta